MGCRRATGCRCGGPIEGLLIVALGWMCQHDHYRRRLPDAAGVSLLRGSHSAHFRVLHVAVSCSQMEMRFVTKRSCVTASTFKTAQSESLLSPRNGFRTYTRPRPASLRAIQLYPG